MKTTQTFSTLIWANRRNKSKKDAALFLRITIDGQRAELSLKKKINFDNWDPNACCMKGTGGEAKVINNYITQVKAEIFKIYTQMQMFDEFITAEAVRLKFTGEKEEKKTLLQVFDFHNTEMAKSIGVMIEKVTLTKYLTVRKKVADFILHQYKKSDLFLQEHYPEIEARKFFNHFQSNGWKVGGKSPMKDWHAAAHNWMLNTQKFNPPSKPNSRNLNLNNTKNYGEPL